MHMDGMIDAANDTFGAVVNCAVRYCLGRETYMPSLVIDFVIPLLPYITRRTLDTLSRDICEASQYGGYGDDTIDKPDWMDFLSLIKEEQSRRDNMKTQISWTDYEGDEEFEDDEDDEFNY